jgi:hypothetical protein
VRIRLVPFPESIAAWHAPGRRLEEDGAAYASSTVSIGPAVESPLTDQVTAGWSQAMGAATVLSVDAVWLWGSHQVGSLNYNPLVPALGPGRRPNDIDGQPGTSAEVFQYTDFGRSWYRGLLVALQHRPAGRLDLRASYTWSRAEDNSSVFLAHVEDSGQGRNATDPLGLPLGFDPDRERGPAPNDRPHLGVLSGTLTLPKGLTLSAILTGRSGRPFTPLAGVDLNGDGLPLADRARRDPAAFASSVGRHSERMRAEATADLRIAWRRALGIRGHLDLIFETFNILNRANFSEVHDTFGAGAFPGNPQRDEAGRVAYGRYTKSLAPRQAQLAMRVTY